MNKIFLNNIGDLGEAQRASFFHFLSKGISEELATFSNPILTKILLKDDILLSLFAKSNA